MKFLDERLEMRFWEKVVENPVSGCWDWIAGKSCGYGSFTIKREDGSVRYVKSHRHSFEAAGNVIPAGFVIDHACSNRACVNPQHLRSVTIEENSRRGNQNRKPKTHCPHGHEYTPENSMSTGRGVVCRACARERSRRKNPELKTMYPFRGRICMQCRVKVVSHKRCSCIWNASAD